jgi:FkbM family methyltransferase
MKKLRNVIVSILRLPALKQISSVLLGTIVAAIAASRDESPTGPAFTVMQVGGRGGADPYTKWLRLQGKVKTIGVEPESSGLEKMRRTHAYDWIIPHAFADKDGKAPLYITKARGWCSLLKPDETAIQKVVTPLCWKTRPFEVIGTEMIDVTTIDALRAKLPAIDFLQIDVQGAELAVLQGAKETLKNVAVLELEVRMKPIYENEKTYEPINAYLEDHGFSLFQMTQQGELEFGTQLVEANACWLNARIAEENPELIANLKKYAKAKHELYGNSFLRLLCDVQSTEHLSSAVVTKV